MIHPASTTSNGSAATSPVSSFRDAYPASTKVFVEGTRGVYPGNLIWADSVHFTSPSIDGRCVNCHDPHATRSARTRRITRKVCMARQIGPRRA